MNRFAMIVSTLAIVTFVGSSFARDAKEEVTAAVKKLQDSDNYSWTTSTRGGGGGGGGVEGKTQKDGLTHLDMEMRDGRMQVVLKGDKSAFHTPDGWQSTADAGNTPPPDPNAGGRPGPARMISNMVRNYQPPAAQAQHLAEAAQDLKRVDDGYEGTLSEEEAKALLQRRVGRREGGGGGGPGGGGPEFKDAKGSVRFWSKDDVLTKFEFNVTGTMVRDGEERPIDRTTTVEIKDVNSTKIEIPEEARAKMD
jgi:hypothetical protein